MTSIAQRRRRKKAAKITLPGGAEVTQRPTGRDRRHTNQPEDARKWPLEARLRVAGICPTAEAIRAAVSPAPEIPQPHRVMCATHRKELTMKKLILTVAFGLISTAALAETPNRTTMSFAEFVEASGCVIVDKGGYQNLAAADGGNCPFAVTQAFIGNSSRFTTDKNGDGIEDDPGYVSDN